MFHTLTVLLTGHWQKRMLTLRLFEALSAPICLRKLTASSIRMLMVAAKIIFRSALITLRILWMKRPQGTKLILLSDLQMSIKTK